MNCSPCPPFEGKTAAELIGQIASRDPAPLRQFDKKIPRDLETIVIKALHKRAQDRYETADDLADDLERFLNHEPVRARRIGPIGRACASPGATGCLPPSRAWLR